MGLGPTLIPLTFETYLDHCVDIKNMCLVGGLCSLRAVVGILTCLKFSGCTPDTVNDFWRMMWEQQASVVVMVTNIKEKGRV